MGICEAELNKLKSTQTEYLTLQSNLNQKHSQQGDLALKEQVIFLSFFLSFFFLEIYFLFLSFPAS